MMLKKSRNRLVGSTEYYRWTVQIPPDVVEVLGWKAGDALTPKIVRGTLRIQRVNSKKRMG